MQKLYVMVSLARYIRCVQKNLQTEFYLFRRRPFDLLLTWRAFRRCCSSDFAARVKSVLTKPNFINMAWYFGEIGRRLISVCPSVIKLAFMAPVLFGTTRVETGALCLSPAFCGVIECADAAAPDGRGMIIALTSVHHARRPCSPWRRCRFIRLAAACGVESSQSHRSEEQAKKFMLLPAARRLRVGQGHAGPALRISRMKNKTIRFYF